MEIQNLDQGTSVKLSLANRNNLKGKFLRLESAAADEYTAENEKYQQSILNDFTLPHLYDSISINQNYNSIFLGFDYGYLKVKRM